MNAITSVQRVAEDRSNIDYDSLEHKDSVAGAVVELDRRLEAIETWIDEQKAKAGSKDPSRSALHVHLDEVLDQPCIKIEGDTKTEFRNVDIQSNLPAQIHKFFRALQNKGTQQC